MREPIFNLPFVYKHLFFFVEKAVYDGENNGWAAVIPSVVVANIQWNLIMDGTGEY